MSLCFSAPSEVLLRSIIASAWNRCIHNSKNSAVDATERLTHFHSSEVPTIALDEYVVEVCRRLRYDPYTVLAAALLAERLWASPKNACSALTAHRVFATTIAVSGKLLHDKPWKNRDVAFVCGLPASELSLLERLFVDAVQFDLYIRRDHIEQIIRSASTTPTPSHHALRSTEAQEPCGVRHSVDAEQSAQLELARFAHSEGDSNTAAGNSSCSSETSLCEPGSDFTTSSCAIARAASSLCGEFA